MKIGNGFEIQDWLQVKDFKVCKDFCIWCLMLHINVTLQVLCNGVASIGVDVCSVPLHWAQQPSFRYFQLFLMIRIRRFMSFTQTEDW